MGGGGLLAGVSIAFKALSPKTKVIGVEPTGASSLYQSLKNKKICHLDSVSTIADTLAVPYTGELNLAAASKFVDEIICVSDDQIKTAMKFLIERCKLVVEPGGSIGLVPILSKQFTTTPKTTNVIILSGGNANLRFLANL